MPDGTVDELAILYPAPVSITVAGRAIEIKRCGIAQGSRLLQIGVPLWEGMPEGSEPAALFDAPTPELRALIAMACNADRAFIDGLDGIDLYAIAAKWWEVNAAFFVQRLLPSYAAMAKGTRALTGAGPV